MCFVPEHVDAADGRVDAQLDAARMPFEQLLEEPDAGRTLQALKVELQAPDLGARQHGSVLEDGSQPVEGVGAQIGGWGRRTPAQFVVALEAPVLDELIHDPASLAAERSVLGAPVRPQGQPAMSADRGLRAGLVRLGRRGR